MVVATEPRFAVGFVGAARRDAVDGENSWEMLTATVGPAGPTSELAKLIAEVEEAQQAGRDEVAAAIRAAIAAVPTGERDRLQKQLNETGAQHVQATREKKAAAIAVKNAVASGDPELEHERREDDALAAVKRLERRRDTLQTALVEAENTLRAAQAAARVEVVAKLRAKVSADLRRRNAEVGNALAAALPGILTARTLLEESLN